MATGARPFTGRTNAAVMEAIRQEVPFPARDLNTAVPDELNRIIEKALEKNRKLRYQTASDLGADLRRLKRDLDTPGRPAVRVSGQERTSDSPETAAARRLPRRVWGIAQLVGACLLGFALAVFPSSSPENTSAGPVRPVTQAPSGAHADDPADTARAGAPTLTLPDAAPARPVAAPPRPGAVTPPRSGRTTRAVGRVDRPRRPIASSRRRARRIDFKSYDQALATLADVVRTNGANAATETALFLMGEVHEAKREYDKAFSDYLDASKRFPDSSRAPEALYAMARVILQSKPQTASSGQA